MTTCAAVSRKINKQFGRSGPNRFKFSVVGSFFAIRVEEDAPISLLQEVARWVQLNQEELEISIDTHHSSPAYGFINGGSVINFFRG